MDIKCRHCGAKNCNRTHQNADVLNTKTRRKEKKDVYRCGTCSNVQHEPPTVPISEEQCKPVQGGGYEGFGFAIKPGQLGG